MNVVIAIDSFKGSLSTQAAGNAVKEGVLAVYPDAHVTVSPLADGGEGTVDALCAGLGGEIVSAVVTGPLGEPVTAKYGILPDRQTAIIEMAAAAGITLVPPEKRDPLITTTYGVGELILDAIKKHGVRHFIIGIGGSATNDGGAGMLSALGFAFLDKNGLPIPMGAKGLESLSSIDCGSAFPALSECEFHIACDVKNPLCGDNGCSAVYGPQKGATEENIPKMDAWLLRYAQITESATGISARDREGAGAAGGLGFAFLSYLGGVLKSGISLVMEATGLEACIRDADIVVTGEGRLDGQSAMGKAPVGVAALAKKYGKPVIAFAGCVTEGAKRCHDFGIDAYFPILPAPMALSDAMAEENAVRNLRSTAEEAFRFLRAMR